MTRKIVLSDIEFAEKLLSAGCEQSAIIAALQNRGLVEEEAARVVQGLVSGNPIKPDVLQIPSRPAAHHHKHRHRSDSGSAFNWKIGLFLILLLALALFWFAFFLVYLGEPERTAPPMSSAYRSAQLMPSLPS